MTLWRGRVGKGLLWAVLAAAGGVLLRALYTALRRRIRRIVAEEVSELWGFYARSRGLI